MSNTEKVISYLQKAGMFFVTTENGSKPKCRPFSFVMEYQGKIFFGVGTFKECYKQMIENPNVEICASDGKGFLRYYGRAVFDDNPEIEQAALDAMPMLRNMYNEKTGNRLGMFYLTDAVAEFRNIMGIDESINM